MNKSTTSKTGLEQPSVPPIAPVDRSRADNLRAALMELDAAAEAYRQAREARQRLESAA